MNKKTLQGQIHHSLRLSLLLATRQLFWWDFQRALVDDQESVDIIRPWFSMLIYHLRDEQ
jgi:hypothetical protein